MAFIHFGTKIDILLLLNKELIPVVIFLSLYRLELLDPLN
jgi:hypothetical protein